MLKGPDAVIAAAAESLGLGVYLVPIWPKAMDSRDWEKEQVYSSYDDGSADTDDGEDKNSGGNKHDRVDNDPFLTGPPSMLNFKKVRRVHLNNPKG